MDIEKYTAGGFADVNKIQVGTLLGSLAWHYSNVHEFKRHSEIGYVVRVVGVPVLVSSRSLALPNELIAKGIISVDEYKFKAVVVAIDPTHMADYEEEYLDGSERSLTIYMRHSESGQILDNFWVDVTEN